MNHILYVLPYMNLGGTEKQALSLMSSLQQRYHISLLAPDGLGAEPFIKADFVYAKFSRLDQDLLGGLRQFRQSLLAIHHQKPIDLIHVHAAHELMLLIKLVLPQIPIVFTVHGYHGNQKGISYFSAAIFSNLFANQVITVAQVESQVMRSNGLRSIKNNLVYNGVAIPEIDQPRSINLAQQFACGQPGQITLGTAARLSEAKGLVYLIQAAAQLIDRHPNIKLVIAGDGELKESLQQMTNSLGLNKQVVFAGYLQNVHDLISSFDIFVLPSLHEALPLASAEAMAMRKPIVGTNVGGIPEQVLDGVTGFIVPPKDPASLAQSIDKLISDPELMAEFGKQGYHRYQEKFALAVMVQATVDIYEKVMAE
jgi:L-malate glycosyltransferase